MSMTMVICPLRVPPPPGRGFAGLGSVRPFAVRAGILQEQPDVGAKGGKPAFAATWTNGRSAQTMERCKRL